MTGRGISVHAAAQFVILVGHIRCRAVGEATRCCATMTFGTRSMATAAEAD